MWWWKDQSRTVEELYILCTLHMLCWEGCAHGSSGQDHVEDLLSLDLVDIFVFVQRHIIPYCHIDQKVLNFFLYPAILYYFIIYFCWRESMQEDSSGLSSGGHHTNEHEHSFATEWDDDTATSVEATPTYRQPQSQRSMNQMWIEREREKSGNERTNERRGSIDH